ncbi:DUF4870 domain-containing protein [Desulforhabdus amnigena]|jgi:uncharacterized Tic20 family protein|uniref:DUF4870 domain-containing protein n=1 Tax=Desulforhabdus amnigena TaxID=40218 RepID=A0A9W6CVJ0_9BACT|nr:DUF4870 domain-containing protein [Desulforhabdus amnigena]NLJ28718.1 DUF4870 domain-containing protein [Deltaproteobacteria bacterium]GLI33314.1 hypothetical protein DAMNIGENAA_07470 [Desulforhabdus amnigena]
MGSANQKLPIDSKPDVEDDLQKQEKNWAMFCHLSALLGFIWFPVGIYLLFPFGHIIGPLLVWLIKRKEFPFVDEQGKEALNFQISMTIYALISSLLVFVIVGFFGLMALAIVDIVLVIIAAGKASEGISYRYPFTMRFIK